MFGSRIEPAVYLKGLGQILIEHPSVDVDQVVIEHRPDDAEISTVFVGLITVRFKADPLIEDQLRKFAAGMVARELFGADQLRCIYAQEPHSHFWKQDAEAKLDRHVNGVAVAHLLNAGDELVRVRPLLQFFGKVRVKSAGSSRHRRSVR